MPDQGDIFPNGGFEETTKPGVPDSQIYYRPEYMSLDSAVVHAGKNSLRLNPTEQNSPTNFGVLDLRVEGGRKYAFAFWGKALDTKTNVSCTSGIVWMDKNREYLKDDKGVVMQESVMAEGYTKTDFDWKQFEGVFTAPKDACFSSYTIQSYAKVGHLWMDDLSVRPQ